MRRNAILTALTVLGTLVAPATHAQLPVFTGDPVNPATSTPYTILPGVGSVQPGADEDFNTSDDEIDAGTVGDVDIVVRMGGLYAGGAIPTPVAGVAAAPAVVPGGTQLGSGSEVPFQVIVSDGAAMPAAGNPLLGSQHDNRAVVVLAYPDLDGDGFIGATALDGSGDDTVERQETMTVIGRQVGLLQSGVAGGGLGVSLAAPASSGGLGVAVVAGALMGDTAPRYFDGPWVGTLMPAMPPISYEDLIGGGNGTRAPDGMNEYLVEIEFEYEKWFMPAAGHPLLGTPYAIATDGSSITNDLLRAESGAAVSALLAPPVQAAGYVANPARRLLPAVGSGGTRQVVERVDAITLGDDGVAATSLLLFATDILGNPAAPSAPMAVTIEAGSGLAITTPDVDSNTASEPITLSSANGVDVTITDGGGASDRNPTARLVVVSDGAPTAWLDVLGGTGTCGNSVVDGAEECDDGNAISGDGCEADCTDSRIHDSVVLAPKPLSVKLSQGTSSLTKIVKVKVRNADVAPTREQPGHSLKLVAQDGTCPAGTVSGLPDFDSAAIGSQDSVVLEGGMRATARVPITITAAAFDTINGKAPARCVALLSVTTDVPSGNTDPAPHNDSVPLEITVFDKNDVEQSTAHESAMPSLKPVSIKLGEGASSTTKLVKITAVNADILPASEDPGHAMTVTADDGDCPAGTISAADFDTGLAGAQSSATAKGGGKARGSVAITVNATAFSSRNAYSPDRCTATVSVAGPGGDVGTGNDVARIIIDVDDGNDY